MAFESSFVSKSGSFEHSDASMTDSAHDVDTISLSGVSFVANKSHLEVNADIGSQPDTNYSLVSTQSMTQSQPYFYDPELDKGLVGRLDLVTQPGKKLDLSKTKKHRSWTIGRNFKSDFVLPSGLHHLSNSHCKLTWNGKETRESEVLITDKSKNGTWINATLVRDETSILRNGDAISFGSEPNGPGTVCRFIFRDIEGQFAPRTRQMRAKYDIGRELGVGSFARVHKCVERASGDHYAAKIIDKSRITGSHSKSVAREIKILKQLAECRHANIVLLHEYFDEDDAVYLMLEYVPGGTLSAYIRQHDKLPESQARHLAAQMCRAVAYIHSQDITHRDLKPENIMLTAGNPPDCKVADFGLAKLIDDQTFLKTVCGTPVYLAPEVALRLNPSAQAYDNRVDSWSLGAIIYYMFTGHTPFYETFDSNADTYQKRRYFGARQVNWEQLRSIHISGEGFDFISCLLVENPLDRNDVTSMLDHQWISHLVPFEARIHYPQLLPPLTSNLAPMHASARFQSFNPPNGAIPGISTISQGDNNPGDISMPNMFLKSMGVARPSLQDARLAPPTNLSLANNPDPSQRPLSPTRAAPKRKRSIISDNSSSQPSPNDDKSAVKNLTKSTDALRIRSKRGDGIKPLNNVRRSRPRPTSGAKRRCEDVTVDTKSVDCCPPPTKIPRHV